MAKAVPFGSRASRTGQTRVLRAALDAIRQDRPIAAFDLDSTLLVNRGRQSRIVREFGAARDDPRLERCTVAAVTSWDLGDTLAACGLPAEESEALLADLREFWRPRFFSSEYCREDTPAAGATGYLRAVRARGGEIVYVTGRHEGMAAGTLESFARAGFPLPDGNAVQLWMKPLVDDDDDRWKEICHARLKELRGLACAFDNEPMHVNAYKRSFPDACVVHVDTDHSRRPVEVLPEIPSILDFVMEPG